MPPHPTADRDLRCRIHHRWRGRAEEAHRSHRPVGIMGEQRSHCPAGHRGHRRRGIARDDDDLGAFGRGQCGSPGDEQLDDPEVIDLSDLTGPIPARARAQAGGQHGALELATRGLQDAVRGFLASARRRQVGDDVGILQVDTDHRVSVAPKPVRGLAAHPGSGSSDRVGAHSGHRVPPRFVHPRP